MYMKRLFFLLFLMFAGQRFALLQGAADKEQFFNLIESYFYKDVSDDELEKYFTNDFDIDVKNEDGVTALHIAVEREKISLVTCLIKNNASVYETEPHGGTVIHIAVVNNKDTKILQKLFDAHAPINAQTQDTQETALYLAAQWHKEKMVTWLLDHGANPCLPNKDGAKPVDVACSQKIIKKLQKAEVKWAKKAH